MTAASATAVWANDWPAFAALLTLRAAEWDSNVPRKRKQFLVLSRCS